MQFHLERFSKIGDSLRREIEEVGKLVTFGKRDDPFGFDITLEYFFFFFSGKLKVFEMNLSNGKEQTLYLLGRGDMFDTVTLLDDQPHEVMTEVLEPGEALRVPIGKVREWMYRYPVFGEIVLKYVAAQIRHVEELAADLTLLDTKERLIKLIIQNLERSERTGQNLLENLSHAEIAKLIGTVRHVVDRHIKQLKNEGVIEAGRRKIALKDMEKLQEKLDNIL
ncbi:Crp/Fnr family transcriptional regulator [Nitratifractor salsuginis]|uniref:Transcriptional regulator, Crp/Fnr family n=1 Tax=Nitratifractor salsuginis (strain DSM 16511 / JCM 12458 / E9I37-1) TaxID=749222 RepID=E6X2M1_NITSE|nr:Crp/Fnr family transcriptional regulator [Nitratifractor salsuginis]ADV46087.1 transcriptional regulator, Crp/Fnr family [Nitratifractor salsuginis DSM 16511]